LLCGMVRAQTRGWPLRKKVRGGLLPPGLSLVVYGLARPGGGWCKNQRNTYITARTPTFYQGRQRVVRDLYEGFRERPLSRGAFAGRVLVSQVWVGARRSHQGRQRAVRALHAGSANDLDRWVRLLFGAPLPHARSRLGNFGRAKTHTAPHGRPPTGRCRGGPQMVTEIIQGAHRSRTPAAV